MSKLGSKVIYSKNSSGKYSLVCFVIVFSDVVIRWTEYFTG